MSTTNKNQDPESLEHEVDARRSDLNRTLNAVEQKLSPNHLMDQAMEYFGDNGSDIAQSVSRSFKDNPLPLILTGVGLAWLISSQSRSGGRNHHETYYRDQVLRDGDGRGRTTNDTGDAYPYARVNTPSAHRSYQAASSYSGGSVDSDDDGSMMDKFGERMNEWTDTAEQWKEDLSSQLTSMKQEAGESAEDWQARIVSASVEHSQRMDQSMRQAHRQASFKAREHAQSAKNFMQEQPLVAGALGIAAGALIGALLPSTSVEDKLIGERAADVKSTMTDKAAQVSSEAASVVSDKAKELREKGEEKLGEVESKSKDAEDRVSPA